MSKAGKRLIKAAKQARTIAVTPSCGCVYCDLGLPAYVQSDGRVIHESNTTAVRACLRAQPVEPASA